MDFTLSNQTAENDESAHRMKAAQLAEMCAIPFAVKAAVTLDVPRILVNAGPGQMLSPVDIAALIKTPTGAPACAQNLDRILRVLVSTGVVKEALEQQPGKPALRKYGATGVMKYLIDDDQGTSLAPFLVMHLDSVFVDTLQHLHAPILDPTVEPHVLAHGKSSFEWAATNERFDKLFNRVMANYSALYMPLMLEKYRGFDDLHSLADVGGGLGATVASIVAKHPHIRGINFDQPHVVAAAPEYPGVTHVGGNFFESVPEADAIFMKWILHDWDDESCVKIMKNIERALPPYGKFINFDAILPESSDPSPATNLNLCTNLLMMAYNSGGKERTLTEFKELGLKSGFKRVEVIICMDNEYVLEFHKT